MAGSFSFSIFLITGHLKSIPKDLIDAATIDGCSDFQLLAHIIAPLAQPIIIAIGIFLIVESWNNFLLPLLLVRENHLFTLPLQLKSQFVGEYSTQYELFFAAVLVTSLPLVLAYMKFQKYFVYGLSGGVKG